MEWAQVHIEAIKDNCLRHVKFNQPIPKEVLDNIQRPSQNSSEDNTTTSTTASPDEDQALIFTPEILETIKELSCLNDCSGNGQCVKGTKGGSFQGRYG